MGWLQSTLLVQLLRRSKGSTSPVRKVIRLAAVDADRGAVVLRTNRRISLGGAEQHEMELLAPILRRVGMKKSSKDRRVRLQVTVSENELQAIDEYRFQFRLQNRSAAVRALLQKGMSPATEATLK